MALTQTKTPYEFLARWTEDGAALKGAHIAFIETIKDGATVLSLKVGDAQPVSLAGEQGFPLAQALAALNAAAIADGESKAAQIVQMAADHQAQVQQLQDAHAAAVQQLQEAHAPVIQALASAEQARDQATALVQELQARLTTYESPADVNGVPAWVYKSQAYKALTVAGKFDFFRGKLVEAAALSMPGKLALVDFDTSAKFYRKHPTVQMMIDTGLLTDAEADQLWKLAATFPT